MITFLIYISIITLAYVLVILLINIGWSKTKEYHSTDKSIETFVSIIIPVRNEEDNISHCLKDLIQQNYPASLFEVIIVDDSSEDNTVRQAKDFIKSKPEFNIKLLHNKDFNSSKGKKSAIANSIKTANGRLIITSDADCRFGMNYIATITDYYEKFQPKMILGPVCFDEEETLFQKMQSLEFLSLIGSSAGALKTIGPLMCNGANLAYEKEAFISTGGFNNNINYASGDDLFLMFNINKKYPGSIHFIRSKEAIVKTKSSRNICDFIEQRKRWVSKTKGYSSFIVIFVSVIIFLFSLSILALFIGTFFSYKYMLLALLLIFIKSFVDYPLLKGITEFMNKIKLIKYFIPLQFIYILYVPFIAVIANISGYKWKGRNIKY